MSLFSDQPYGGKQFNAAVHDHSYDRMTDGIVGYERALQQLQEQTSISRGDGASPSVASGGWPGQTTPGVLSPVDRSESSSVPKGPFSIQNNIQPSPELVDVLADQLRFTARPGRLNLRQQAQMPARIHAQQESKVPLTLLQRARSNTKLAIANATWNPAEPSNLDDAGATGAGTETGGSNHALQDYQMQLMLLEQQNKKRLMMARQEQDEISNTYAPGNGPQPSTPQAPSDEPPVGSQADQDNMRSQETPATLTHYTISEDKTADSGQRDKLYAIGSEPKSNIPQPPLAPGMAPVPPTLSRSQQPWAQHPKPDREGPIQKRRPQTDQAWYLEPSPGTKKSHSVVPVPRVQGMQPRKDIELPGFDPSEWNMDGRKEFKGFPKREKTPPEVSLSHQIWGQFSPSFPVPGAPPFPTTNLNAEPASTSSNPGQSADDSNPGGGFSENSGVSLWANQPDQANLLQQMMQRIWELEAENQRLRPEKSTAKPENILPLNIQVFHRILDNDSDMVYLSEPEWEVHEDVVLLRGRLPISDPKGYVEHKGNVAFTVYNCYSVEHQQRAIEQAMRDRQPLPQPTPVKHEIVLNSDKMRKAITTWFNQWPNFRTDYPEVDEEVTLDSPFIWWYHHRRSKHTDQLSTSQARLISTLTDWIEANYASLYNRIDEQFQRGRVSHESVEYLVRPGDVLISVAQERPLGYVATSRPQRRRTLDEDGREQISWDITLRSYNYAGKFLRKDVSISLDLGAESTAEEEEVDIRNLTAVPLKYASSENRDILEQRAKTFWKFRTQRLMSYLGHHTTGKYAGQRFMLDFTTYKELHPYNHYSTLMSAGCNEETYLPTDGSEPEAPEIYLFPLFVPGFDFRRKEWVDLQVDQLRDVTWNDQAFRSLVAEDDMKQLILALVTNQLDADQGTDLIDNKGNGLIMLLHGSPGTGKTFTAESVAEIAKKPLYPVTCGDIGTQPGDVEKYLNSVFHLGKIWDCVVLLDEAEVFLEQRTLQDLNRNALVSVFLRALEYYEGILILTTNRVGTFDEAFKSRIQLSLRYERLQRHQRKQIWLNFMSHLKALGEQDRIDFNDIELNIDELAEHPMNGRQIRNSITTGRQLAKYQKTRMTLSHLKRTIAVADKFDKYLGNVREGVQEKEADRGPDGMYSDEYWARADMTR